MGARLVCNLRGGSIDRAAFRLGVREPFGRSEALQLLASNLRCRDGWRGRTGEVGSGFVRAQPNAITDCCSHAVADTRPYAIAHSEPNTGAYARPHAGTHS